MPRSVVVSRKTRARRSPSRTMRRRRLKVCVWPDSRTISAVQRCSVSQMAPEMQVIRIGTGIGISMIASFWSSRVNELLNDAVTECPARICWLESRSTLGRRHVVGASLVKRMSWRTI